MNRLTEDYKMYYCACNIVRKWKYCS